MTTQTAIAVAHNNCYTIAWWACTTQGFGRCLDVFVRLSVRISTVVRGLIYSAAFKRAAAILLASDKDSLLKFLTMKLGLSPGEISCAGQGIGVHELLSNTGASYTAQTPAVPREHTVMRFLKRIASRLRRSQQEDYRPLSFKYDETWLILCDEASNGEYIGDSRADPQIDPDTPFPVEIWRLVVKHLMTPYITRDGTGAQVVNNKVQMYDIIGLISASKLHRTMVFEFWAHTFNPLRYDDPTMLKQMAKSNGVDILCYVRQLVCRDKFQIYKAPKHAFQHFAFIEELVFDGHLDIDFGTPRMLQGETMSQTAQALTSEEEDDEPQGQEQPFSRMAYRRLAVIFPPSLQILRVYNGHAPDIYLIRKVIRECPKLQTLTVARCTLFTMAGCQFWDSLPRSESDSYFNNEQVAEYATAIGKELGRLRILHTVQIGVYLTEHAAIRTHIHEHAGFSSEEEMSLSDWKRPCDKCTAKYQRQTDLSQEEAATVLGKLVPSLVQVSWLSFCSNGRTEWATQHVLRGSDGCFQGLATSVD
ncbi:hypothetical protein BDV93DRAFT_581796 [Ceratobasidium sp. AG-I]|nr:hypothetical protein BDV93DRAFT_581796 [Ceratobasidium sp. AG-I]